MKDLTDGQNSLEPPDQATFYLQQKPAVCPTSLSIREPAEPWTPPQWGLLHSSGNPQQGRFLKSFRRKVTGNYSVQFWGFCQTKSLHSACKACLSISNWQLMIQQSLQSLGLCIWLSHYDAIFQGKLIHLLFWVQGLVFK